MTDPPTFASVTDIPCKCGYLQDAADDRDRPIQFDQKTGEFHFRYGENNACMLVIYHCPFCGGAAPKSKRRLLFAVIPDDEQVRLAKLLDHVKSVRSALKRLGRPDRDDPAGMSATKKPTDDSAPIVQFHRTLVYENLSDVADVHITEQTDGRVRWYLSGKYIGPVRPMAE